MENKIGEMISRARQNLGLTQEELASRLGVTAQAVSRWERGGGLPDIALVAGICEVLQISADELLGITVKSVVENGDFAMDREIRRTLFSEPVTVEFGRKHLPAVAQGIGTDYVNRKRRELAAQTGMLLPLLRIRDNLELPDSAVRILFYDEVYDEMLFEEAANENADVWREAIDRTVKECREHYGEILNKQLVKTMVDTVKELYPGVADGVIPEKISYLQTLQFLRKKLEETGSLRNMVRLLEELEGMAQSVPLHL